MYSYLFESILSLVYKDAQTDSLALGLLCQDAWEGTSGENFLQGQPNIFTAIKIQENWSLNNSQLNLLSKS